MGVVGVGIGFTILLKGDGMLPIDVGVCRVG